jgi:flagellar basal body rod protein FlgG
MKPLSIVVVGSLGVAMGCQPASRVDANAAEPNASSMRLVAQSAAALRTPADAIAAADEASLPLASAIRAVDEARKIVANNLANAESTAFKRLDVVFSEAGKPEIRLDLTQGSIDTTSRSLDVAIEGPGFFRVITKGIGDGYAYTRNGNFFINNNGELVLGMGDGYRLDPPIAGLGGFAEDRITIAQDGTVSVIPNGSLTPVQLGQLQLARFTNPQALHNLGGSLWQQTTESGEPIITNPIQDGAGKVLQGYLEGSNVDATREELRLRKLNEWREQLISAARSAK